VPWAFGFGIRDAETAVAVAPCVGRGGDRFPRIIQLIENEPRERVVPVAAGFLREIRAALDTLQPSPGETA